MILRAAISIYLVVVFVSLCSKPSYTPRNQFGVTQQLGCPVAGIAMRQGRRFAMEDRVVLATAELSANPICGGASYTFAAVYDGHEGSAACNMLQQQLQPLVQAAVAASWQSSCSIHSQQVPADITAAAHDLNEAFLQNVSARTSQAATLKSYNSGSSNGGLSAAAGTATNSSSEFHIHPSKRQTSTASLAASADGSDGSTALFAVLVGSQLLIGNVGNSRAIVCSGNKQNSNSSNGSASQVLQREQSLMVAGSSSADAQTQQPVEATGNINRCNSCSGKDVIPYRVVSDGADSLASEFTASRSMNRVNSNDISTGGTCSARSGFPYDPPEHVLQPILLSSEHTPARPDEAARVAAAGGQIFVSPATPNGKPRVNGELEVTRSFGDLGFQNQGVIATPEFTTVNVSPEDAFLVLASDGVFEALSPKEVCQHAWGVWSKSSSIATALPPPPALALTGQVASADSQLQEAAGSAGGDPAEGVAGGIIGCCDCTPQQRIREAAEAAQVDFGVLLRRRKRSQRRRVAVHSAQMNEVVAADRPQQVSKSAGATRADAGSAADPVSPDSQQSQHVQREQIRCRAEAGMDSCSRQGREGQQQQQVQAEGQPVVCRTSGGSGVLECGLRDEAPSDVLDGAACEVQDDTTAPADDADGAVDPGDDDDCSADPTYAYCRDPNGISAPYTLPQAIALRVVGEAYNRMSMDNLAVMVLDVRHLGTISAASKPQAQHAAWAAKWHGLWGTMQGFISRLFEFISGCIASRSQSNMCRTNKGQLDDAASVAGGGLPALVQPSAVAQQNGAPSDNGLLEPVDEADLYDELLQTLGVNVLTCGWQAAVNSNGQGLQEDQLQQAELVQPSRPQLVQSLHHTSEQHPAAQLGMREASKQWRDIPAGTSIACDAPVEEAPVSAAAHDYMLLQRIAPAMQVEADHLHMHPFLGDETRPVPYAMMHASVAASSLDEDASLSLASHLQSTNLLRHGVGQLAALADASAAQCHDSQSNQATTDPACQPSLDEDVPHAQPSTRHPAGYCTGKAASSGASQYKSDSSKSAAVGWVGTSAEVDLYREGSQLPGGLSAVMAALAAVPLADTSAAAQDSSADSQHPQFQQEAATQLADDRLIEPFWGQNADHDANKGPAQPGIIDSDRPLRRLPSAAAPLQQVKQTKQHAGQWFKAGLLMLAASRPGRTLLGWHPTLRGSSLQHVQQQQKGTVSAEVMVERDGSEVDGDANSQQHEYALQIASDVAHEGSVLSGSSTRFKLGKQAGRGHFGEVWLASRLDVQQMLGRRGHTAQGRSASADRVHHGDAGSTLVIKRTLAARGAHVKQSALREAYFGQLLTNVAKQLRHQVYQQAQEPMKKDDTASAAGGSTAVEPESDASAVLLGHDHVVRYVESFKVPPEDDVWLVFQHEGRSLHSLLYEPVQFTSDDQTADPDERNSDTKDAHQQQPPQSSAAETGLSVVGPSQWWTDVRTSPSGNLFVASIMEQLLQALLAVHSANITHRDVKPENMLVKSKHKVLDVGAVDPSPLSLHMRLIDFGSAVDQPSIEAGLFGKVGSGVAGGPSVDELTMEYAPPEVLFSNRYHHPLSAGVSQLHAYDIWSAGVVMLELVLGTPAVFNPSPATRAAIDKQLHLQGKPSAERHLLYMLRGLMELCVYPPRDSFFKSSTQQKTTPGSHHSSTSQHKPRQADPASLPIPWSCSDDALLRLIASKDPTGVGLEGGLGVRLVQRMLAWNPKQRPTAAQALQHAYFEAARHAVATGSLLFQSTYYQQLLAQCSNLQVGEKGWC